MGSCCLICGTRTLECEYSPSAKSFAECFLLTTVCCVVSSVAPATSERASKASAWISRRTGRDSAAKSLAMSGPMSGLTA